MSGKLRRKNDPDPRLDEQFPKRCLNGNDGIVLGPFRTFFALYATILQSRGNWKGIAALAAGLLIGWWVYVPVHELMHVAGCLLAGGEVTELWIQPLYGGKLLSGIFPFVKSGGEYAGRLAGFQTHGSDLIYAITVYFPYLPTLTGYCFLYLATRVRSAFLFSLFLPLSFAPLISLTGDFYELGSLAVFQALPGPDDAHRMLVGDDLLLLIKNFLDKNAGIELESSGIFFMGLSFTFGAVFAWITLILSKTMADLAHKPRDRFDICS